MQTLQLTIKVDIPAPDETQSMEFLQEEIEDLADPHIARLVMDVDGILMERNLEVVESDEEILDRF